MADKFVVYEEKKETAVLIAISTQQQNREKTEEYFTAMKALGMSEEQIKQYVKEW